jgi:CheY-like chemotaxis protein
MNTHNLQILLIEDQKYPLEALEYVVTKLATMPEYSHLRYDVAKSYTAAVDALAQTEYDVVLLDNKLPRYDVGNLEDTNMRAFCDTLEYIGYTLVPFIQQGLPNALVIGTSSMTDDELKAHNLQKPTYSLDKQNLYDDGVVIMDKLITSFVK